ncbi:MAG: hypothetical protein WCB27_05040, partial [Thermoguttaceae bacterium]
MAKLPIVSWIGNAAAVLVGGWGAVSRQAQAAGCSRQTAYDHAEKVESAVHDAVGGGPTREQLQRHPTRYTELKCALGELEDGRDCESKAGATLARSLI